MKRQRNMAQMKEQNKIPEKELNEMEIANLLGAEFKTLAIKLLREIIEYGKNALAGVCLLYTSDAADDWLVV